MTGFLLDTSVLSVFAPGRPSIGEPAVYWFLTQSDALHVSSVSFIEIEQGLRKLHRAGGHERAARLSAWLDQLGRQYRERVVAIDLAIARTAGQIGEAALAKGRHPGLADVMIAASAASRSLTVLTRNVRHFEPLGVQALDPFLATP